MPLVSRSAALLAEMARRYGAADQIEDPSYLDQVVFRSYEVTIAYDPRRDVFAFQARIGPDAPRTDAPARIRGDEVKRVEIRKLRLARPSGEQSRLYGETPVAGLTYPDFSAAFDEFLEAVALARAGQPLSEEWFGNEDSAEGEELIWFRP